MAITRQTSATTKNTRKAQDKWKSTAPRRARRRVQPGAEPGEFFHIEVRPKTEFVAFRSEDVGGPGGIERIAGKRPSGSWSTHKWLISKDDAHIESGGLVPDTDAARKVLSRLGGKPVRVRADRFKTPDRPDMPERGITTVAQRRARKHDIAEVKASGTGSSGTGSRGFQGAKPSAVRVAGARASGERISKASAARKRIPQTRH
jgi:hypothetical protein